MDEFNKRIENSLVVKIEKKDLIKSYIASVNELYPSIHSYKNKDALEHYRLLILREPTLYVPIGDEAHEIWLKSRAKKYGFSQKVFFNGINEGDRFDNPPIYKPQLSCLLTSKDKKIAGLIKSHCKGVMICLSPPADYYPTISSFVDKVAKTNCKQVKNAKYYFEVNTKNGLRMHCHMYVKMKDYLSKSKNNLRSYFKKRYPYMIIKMDNENSALVYKPDITYGWEEYIYGLQSTNQKKQLKSKDYIWREENNIPHILTL